jgi:hypothetical protein
MDAVRTGWIVLLNQYTWDWFITMTFREPTHPESADKRWRLWVSMINRQLWGPRWAKKKQSVTWVRALELQKRGVIHYHALMSHPKDLNLILSRFAQMQNLNTIAGFARIFPPRSVDAVISYCSKYVIKGGEIECSPYLPTWNPSTDAFELSHNFSMQYPNIVPKTKTNELPDYEHLAVKRAEERKQETERLTALFE